MRFTKLHALGNDFLVVDPREGLDPAAAGGLARRICDRHTGVGADGLLLVSAAKEGPPEAGFRVFNADGSEAEISGNGLRCAAAYLFAAGRASGGRVTFLSATGPRPCELGEREGRRQIIRIDMGVPVLES